MKILMVKACKGREARILMQQELFEVLGQARSREELQGIEPGAREIARRYRDGLEGTEAGELAFHHRGSRLRTPGGVLRPRRCRLI